MAGLIKVLQAIWPFVSVLFAPRDGDSKEKRLLSVIAALVTIYIGCAVTLSWWYVNDFATDTRSALILESNKADLSEATQALFKERVNNKVLEDKVDTLQLELLESKYNYGSKIIEALRAEEEKRQVKKTNGASSKPKRDERGETIELYRQLQLETPR
jgi:signal recognition particle GTPase